MLPPCLCHANVFLVGCCIWNIDRQSFKATTFFLFYFIAAQFATPNDGIIWRPPHTFCPGHAPSPISLLPQTLTFGWLLCCPTKRWPPKAKVTSLSLIFDMLHFGAPNEGTNSKESALTPCASYGPIGISGTKMWVHGRSCHGKRWQSRWRVGRWRLMSVVVCFVVLVFCVVFEWPFSYRRGRKSISA